jgi:hypothetical protein
LGQQRQRSSHAGHVDRLAVFDGVTAGHVPAAGTPGDRESQFEAATARGDHVRPRPFGADGDVHAQALPGVAERDEVADHRRDNPVRFRSRGAQRSVFFPSGAWVGPASGELLVSVIGAGIRSSLRRWR